MIRIITDTASDITLGEATAMGVELVSLRVQFGATPYEQLADEDFSTFYHMLETHREFPTTSQPSPADYLAHYARAKQAGDEVLVITLSSGLSGTFQSATMAAEMADYDRVYVLDSLSAIMGQRLLVEYAVKLRDQGRTAGEIFAILSEAKDRIVVFGALETLKYLRKGGRIPKSAEVIGSVMGIKPVVRLDKEGKIATVGKARGSAGAITKMVHEMENHADFDPVMPVYFGYTKDSAPCKKFRKLCISHFNLADTRQFAVGGTIGAHIGPGAIAFSYLTKSPAHRKDKK